jgi:ASC-1-like (ASCH) protein
MTHDLKCFSEYYSAIKNRVKKFELRFNDRNYKVGDTLILREFDPIDERFTGEQLSVVVLYVFYITDLITNSNDWVILSMSEPLGLSGVQN